MDASLPEGWFSELDSSFEDLSNLKMVLEDHDLQQIWSQESQTSSNPTDTFHQCPKKQIMKANISLADLGSQVEGNAVTKTSQKKSVRMTKKNPPELQDRVMAERKRREKLNKGFIALSAVIPNLKKMDKATVLEDAIRYVKHLQEHIVLLEEKLKAKPQIIVAPAGQKPGDSFSDEYSSSGDESFNPCTMVSVLPKVQVRYSGKSVLIRIQCMKKKGYVGKLLTEVERLDLSVSSSIFFPFGQDALDVTIFAQLEDECDMTMKGLMRNLCSALEML